MNFIKNLLFNGSIKTISCDQLVLRVGLYIKPAFLKPSTSTSVWLLAETKYLLS